MHYRPLSGVLTSGSKLVDSWLSGPLRIGVSASSHLLSAQALIAFFGDDELCLPKQTVPILVAASQAVWA